jgi:hypothetical protein
MRKLNELIVGHALSGQAVTTRYQTLHGNRLVSSNKPFYPSCNYE